MRSAFRRGIDALTAYERSMISEKEFLSIVGRLQKLLRTADCETFDRKGSHLPLSIDLSNQFREDADGRLLVTLCNVEFVRVLCGPFR